MNHKSDVSKAVKDVFGNSRVTAFNAKRILHFLLGHVSVSKGSPVDLLAKKHLGKLWENADPFDNSHCDICLSVKAHRFPHPQKSMLEKQALDGASPSPIGTVYVDTFSWPFAAHDGSRHGMVICSEANIFFAAAPTKGELGNQFCDQLTYKREICNLPISSIYEPTHYEVHLLGEGANPLIRDGIRLMPAAVSDGAHELVKSKNTREYLQRNHIEARVLPAYTPSMNKAENGVRIVTTGIAVNLHQFAGAGAPHFRFLWKKAAEDFVHIRHRTPNKGRLGKWNTPIERLHQKEFDWPALLEGRIPFGSLSFGLKQRAQKEHTHGTPSVVPGAMLGSSRSKLGYSMLTWKTRKIQDGVIYLQSIYDVFPFRMLNENLELGHLSRLQMQARMNDFVNAGCNKVRSTITGAAPIVELSDQGGGEESSSEQSESNDSVASADTRWEYEMLDVTTSTETSSAPSSSTDDSDSDFDDMPAALDSSAKDDSEGEGTEREEETATQDELEEPPHLELPSSGSLEERDRDSSAIPSELPEAASSLRRSARLHGTGGQSNADRAAPSAFLWPENATARAAVEQDAKPEQGEERSEPNSDEQAPTSRSWDWLRRRVDAVKAIAAHRKQQAGALAPASYSQAKSRADSHVWLEAMQKHMTDKIKKLMVVKRAIPEDQLPPGVRPTPSTWVYALKHRQHSGGVEKEASARIAFKEIATFRTIAQLTIAHTRQA